MQSKARKSVSGELSDNSLKKIKKKNHNVEPCIYYVLAAARVLGEAD